METVEINLLKLVFGGAIIFLGGFLAGMKCMEWIKRSFRGEPTTDDGPEEEIEITQELVESLDLQEPPEETPFADKEAEELADLAGDRRSG